MALKEDAIKTCRQYDETFDEHQRVSITVETQGEHIPDDDADWLISHSDTQCPFITPPDYNIAVSERITELTADPRRLLLNLRDTDMRRTLMATIRIPGRQHQRSATGATGQNTRRRKTDVQTKRHVSRQDRRQRQLTPLLTMKSSRQSSTLCGEVGNSRAFARPLLMISAFWCGSP